VARKNGSRVCTGVVGSARAQAGGARAQASSRLREQPASWSGRLAGVLGRVRRALAEL
jgi:hypothetical protein